MVVMVLVLLIAAVSAVTMMGGNNTTNDSVTTDPATGTNNTPSTHRSGPADEGGTEEPNAVATTEVEIEDYAFKPEVIKVKVGSTVTWTNKDTVRHDVRSADGVEGGPNSELLAKDESYSFTFAKAGTYSYFCGPHPYMKARVIVE